MISTVRSPKTVPIKPWLKKISRVIASGTERSGRE